MHLFPPSFDPWHPHPGARAVAVLMSGGVDSTVTALVLKDAGWHVLGVTMKIPSAPACSHPSPCCGADAAVMCARIGVPHYFVDVEAEFTSCIIEPFRRAYAHGRTPNPCVDCNTFLKFTSVWELVEQAFGIRHLATGHYARVVEHDGAFRLCAGADVARDQSYFIYGVPRERLPYFLLPMGDRSKSDVRGFAAARGLEVADKPDSMELCFAGEGDYRHALDEQGNTEGPIRDTSGNRLGTHCGIRNYTVGQRRGLGIPAAEPLYVIRIEPVANTLVVGPRDETLATRVHGSGLHVLVPRELNVGAALSGKIRSYSPCQSCRVIALTDSDVTVDFDSPQFAPAPGQHLVLYNPDGHVIAGATICS